MNRHKYRVGQQLEVFGLAGEEVVVNGMIVEVVAYAGYCTRTDTPMYYIKSAAYTGSGSVLSYEWCLRPPYSPLCRGDLDTPSTWEEFEKETGISADVVKNGRPGDDY